MKKLRKSEECHMFGGRVVNEPDGRDLLGDRVKLSTPTGGSNITTLAL